MRCLTLLVFLFLVVPVMAQKPGGFPPGRVVDLNESSRYDGAVLRKNSDGTRTLSEIRFSGKKQALAIGEAAAKMDAQESSTK